jgi:Na+/proline symporter/nitrogen-specific signal transduction histidine kinase
MLQGWLIVAASFAYLGVLFAIASIADRRADAGHPKRAGALVYSLSLAVYATAWTFYGSVGRAAADGVGFLPIYLGPTLIIALWWLVMRKILRISKINRITSLADFIASRYGKSALLGGVVTIIAVVGILPYISLQLKAVSNSFNILAAYPAIVAPSLQVMEPLVSDTAFWVAVLLAAFTIFFGTRHLDASEHHHGMVAAIAVESVVKLVAFLAVGVFVTFGVYNGFGDIFARVAADAALRPLLTPLDGFSGGYSAWVWLTILSMFAIMFLPRQFQMAVIENVDDRHLRTAIWLFPLYMLAINVFVLPIALGGRLYFPGGNVDADTFVLALPMAERQPLLALVVYLGGLSAATGMVIVETIALSTMVCNDLLMPVLLRTGMLRATARRDLTGLLLAIRRGAIVAIVLLGYLYFRFAGEAYALVSIGLISFAAVAQFAPVAFGALYWRGATRVGALAGLLAGFGVWGYTLLLPAFARSGWMDIDILTRGPMDIGLLRPQQLFGLAGLDPITHAMIWSMIANVGAFVLGSLTSTASPAEHRQARRFVDVFRSDGGEVRLWRGTATVRDLHALAVRFLGSGGADALFVAHARKRGLGWPDPRLVSDAELVHAVETGLAGTIGAASARIMMASTVKEEALSVEEMRRIVDEASQVVVYSHQLEQKSRELERATAELRAANERLKQLDRLKDDFISTVSHELRTPLTSIRAFSEILAETPDLDDAQRREFLDIIVKESERLTRLINTILDLAKLEAGRAEWQLSRFGLGEVVEEAAAATRALFADKGVSLDLRLAPVPATVEADRDRMIQVMINLLSNAVKFAPEGDGIVVVSLDDGPGGLRVSVCDNGPGVAPDDRDVIFDKFRQGGDTLTDRPSGTGLGLAISRQIVEHFGGRLWLEDSTGPGACFAFTLPHLPSAGQASPQEH